MADPKNVLAYKQGCIAATNKKKVGDNPHNEHEETHWQWMRGFTDTLSEIKGLSKL
jgi:hypothetical protein